MALCLRGRRAVSDEQWKLLAFVCPEALLGAAEILDHRSVQCIIASESRRAFHLVSSAAGFKCAALPITCTAGTAAAPPGLFPAPTLTPGELRVQGRAPARQPTGLLHVRLLLSQGGRAPRRDCVQARARRAPISRCGQVRACGQGRRGVGQRAVSQTADGDACAHGVGRGRSTTGSWIAPVARHIGPRDLYVSLAPCPVHPGTQAIVQCCTYKVDIMISVSQALSGRVNVNSRPLVQAARPGAPAAHPRPEGPQ